MADKVVQDVGAVVISIGGYATKAGEAGEDTPKAVLPTSVGFVARPPKENFVGQTAKAPLQDDMDVDEAPPSLKKRKDNNWYFGANELKHYQDNMEIFQHPVKNGVGTAIFLENLRVDATGHPLLFSESTVAPKEQREKLIEFAFEKFGTPAFFVSKEATLSAYASGRATALIVDVGSDMTVVAPVHDAVLTSPYAGNKLTELVFNSVNGKIPEGVRPKYLFTKKKTRTNWNITLVDRPHVTPSFHQYQLWSTMNDIKETVCAVAETAHGNAPVTPGTYELPDGTSLYLEGDRHKIPETLFSPQPMAGGVSQSIRQLISGSIEKADIDVRQYLYGSIVVTGGTTLLNGFTARIQKEIEPPQIYSVKTIIPTDSSERRFSSWVGGSILGSLGTFHQMWISKAEYEETGKIIVHKRCP